MIRERSNLSNILSVFIAVWVVLGVLRWSTSITDKGPVFDEQYIIVPINNLIEKGWTVETAIDFQETKGPAMIWPYAFFGKLFGGTLNDLRLVSVWCSVLSATILAWIGLRCFSLSRKELVLVTIGWLLLPYNIVFSEIVMGESSFLLLSLLAVAVFVWGVEEDPPTSRRFIAPLLYCVVVAVALHSRIHVVALTGGICFTAFALQGKQSWPWWAASIIAGLLRIPLWLRWDGLVSPEYQSLHGLGFRLESLSYLAAAMVPFVGVFAIEGWRIAKSKSLILWSFYFGVLLVFVATPDLTIPEDIDFENPNERFQGIVATFSLAFAPISKYVLAFLAGIGLAGLAGLWHCKNKVALVTSITFWSLMFGWLLYAVTRGFVFDRFLLTWAFLLPIVWIRTLPKWLLIPQFAALTLIAVWLTVGWLC
jgi:hypothetical protein